MDMPDLVVDSDDPLLHSDFVREMLKQLRAIDTYDTYENWSEARIIDPLIMTKQRREAVPVIGDPDEIIVARVKAYYNALSSLIEQRCGLMAVPVINLTHEGFGRAFVMVGKLVVVDKVLRDVHRFGFKSLAQLVEDAEKIIAKAASLVETYPDVAKL